MAPQIKRTTSHNMNRPCPCHAHIPISNPNNIQPPILLHSLETMALKLCPVRRITNIRSSKHKEEEDNLGKEPSPAAALAASSTATTNTATVAAAALLARRRAGSRARLSVEVIRTNGNNVVVVAELARLGTEAEIRNVGNRRRALDVEAVDPLVLVLVLQVQLEVLVLEVREAHLGRDAGMADAAGRAASELAVLAVVVLVVRLLAVAVHRHDVGEHDSRSVVLVRVDKDAQAVKVVDAAKDGAKLAALLGNPHGEAVAKELVLSGDLELDFNLPVRGRQGNARKEPSCLRGSIGCKTNVAVAHRVSRGSATLTRAKREESIRVGSNNGISSKVEPAALHV